MIRNVFLDADDTIFDFLKSEKRALIETLRTVGIEPEPAILARYSEINAMHWKMLERKEITRSELRVMRYESFLREIGRTEVSAEETASIYEVELAKGHFYMEGAEEMLKSIHGKYRLYITSNGFVRTQTGRLKSAGIGHLFDDLFISQEIGTDKPNVGFFEVCFSRIQNFRKEETVIVGDSLTSDILGGNNAGIRTVWYNPKGLPAREDIRPDHEIKHLCELAPLLELLST